MMVKLNYAATVGYATAGGIATQTFITQNSLRDPDARVGGHQPLWFDQWGAIYTNYRVKGWKYIITVYNLSANYVQVFVRHQDISSGETNAETLQERKDTWTKHLGAKNSGRDIGVFRGYIDVAKTVGQTRLDVNTDDQYMASWNADPIKKAYLTGYQRPLANDDAVHWNIKITYYAELSGRLSPGGS